MNPIPQRQYISTITFASIANCIELLYALLSVAFRI